MVNGFPLRWILLLLIYSFFRCVRLLLRLLSCHSLRSIFTSKSLCQALVSSCPEQAFLGHILPYFLSLKILQTLFEIIFFLEKKNLTLPFFPNHKEITTLLYFHLFPFIRRRNFFLPSLSWKFKLLIKKVFGDFFLFSSLIQTQSLSTFPCELVHRFYLMQYDHLPIFSQDSQTTVSRNLQLKFGFIFSHFLKLCIFQSFLICY